MCAFISTSINHAAGHTRKDNSQLSETLPDILLWSAAAMVSTSSPQAVARDASYDGHIESLGSLRLRHEVTNEILLIPAPTNDPNDPLNW